MTTTLTKPESLETAATPSLRRFLNCYWLRPENAFWMALRSRALEPHVFRSPCVDLSCGDGVFSFLHAGGDFALDFDVFQNVGGLDKVRDEHADMFDHADSTRTPEILSPAKWRIDVGTDLKSNLLIKACGLGFYDALVQHDHNESMPFGEDAFETVHCNSAYWVLRIDGFLRELQRITRSGGRILLSVKLDAMRQYTLEGHRDRLGPAWLNLIGRGRIDSWPSLCDDPTWQRRFKDAGLEIVSRTPFVTRTHAHIWDIGLRPIAPLLVRMANALNESTRQEIKSDWIDLMDELLAPLNNPAFDLSSRKDEPAEVLYELTPR
ncbi:MAG: class I SAM-dependent methyltransferase [Planctomycetes bacterium]|nr:class I SAM-dependent methyltransferase [Planctomycetota bacterium]